MYGKVFGSLWNGSMRGQYEVQIVFIYMLCNCDPDGRIDVLPEVIVDATGMSREAVQRAIDVLEGPDPLSRTRDDEGRRIARLDEYRAWGWRIVNHKFYRALTDEETRRHQERERSKRYRSRHAPSCTVTVGHARSRHTDTDTEADTEAIQQTLLCASAMRVRRGVNRKALENGEKLPEGEITADQAFDEIFWPEYPRKRDKEPARKAWKALKLKDTDEAQILAIMRALRRDVKEEWRDRAPDKIPYGATWLHRKGWLDG